MTYMSHSIHNSKKYSSENSILEVSGLSVFKKHPKNSSPIYLVEDIDLSVHENELVAVVGESGCGKSLSMLSLIGLLPKSIFSKWGQFSFLGKDINEASMESLRGSQIGFSFQEPMVALNPLFTVGFQLREHLMLHRGLNASEARERIVSLLGELHINDPSKRFDQYPHELSGGMRQRVMLALALVCEPKLIIADEPTTALDVTVQAEILDLLLEIKSKRGLGILFVTHDLALVRQIADKVVVMYAGSIVETGSTAKIFSEPKHPYTKGLLAASPQIGKKVERLSSIPGMIKDPESRSEGCKFYGRCYLETKQCAKDRPVLKGEASHQHRCMHV